jgi:hypothetical protein
MTWSSATINMVFLEAFTLRFLGACLSFMNILLKLDEFNKRRLG